MKKFFFLLLTAVCLMYACQPKPAEIDKKAISDEITNIEDQWTAANQAKDIEKCMSLYASDATLMIPGEPAVIGIESIRNAIAKDFADTTMLANTSKAKVEKIDIAESGDLVIVRYSYTIQVRPTDRIVDVKGKGLDIFKKVNGDWKCYITTFNNDM